jgi:hypothetical protein
MKIGVPKIAMLFSVTILAVFLYYMNVKGIEYIETNSIPMSSYVNATDWLSRNLGSNDIALVPHSVVFHSLNPSLKDKFKDYKTIWERTKITLRANTSSDEVSKVRYYLQAIILNEPRLKYLVIDWFNPYSNRIFINRSCSDLGDLLREVKTFDFEPPHIKWKNKLTICEVNRKT